MFKTLFLLAVALTTGLGAYAKSFDSSRSKYFLSMNYWSFDQTAQGWRSITSKSDAGDLCKLYFDCRKDISKSRLANVAFHAGQNYAFANSNEAAVRMLKQSFQRERVDWNAYVRGTIAFLNGDKTELLKQRNILAKMPGQLNIEVLDRLIKHFGKSYSEAYSS